MEAPTEGYCLVVRGCGGGYAASVKHGNCLHPLFHDARPGRGYGRGVSAAEGGTFDSVDGEWMYTNATRPPPSGLHSHWHRWTDGQRTPCHLAVGI